MKDITRRSCTKCTHHKPLNRFRKRYKLRNGKKEHWTMGKCMDCEAKERKVAYYSDIEKGRRLGRETAKKHYAKRKIYNDKYRKDNPKWWRDYMDKYRKENKDHISKLHKITGDKWFKKQRDTLSDSYVISKIIGRGDLKRSDIENQTELIELYRQNLILKRKINETNSEG